MRKFITTLGIVCASSTVATAEVLPIDPLWKSEGFRKAMTGSYGIDSRIEPRITIDEEEFLDSSAKAMADGDREAAIKILSDTSVLEKSPTLRFALANLQFETEESETAIENFRKAIEQFPNFRDAHRNLAIALVQSEEFEDAKPHLIRAIELGSREGITMGLLAYCHSVDENHQAALQAYRLAQLTMPEERQWKLGEAQALQALDQPQSAVSLYNDLLKETPTDSPIWMNLANTQLQLGRSIPAVAEMEIVRRLGKLTGPALLSLGNLYLNESLVSEAVSCYNESLSLPELPPLEKAVESLEYLSDRAHWDAAKHTAAKVVSAFPEANDPRLIRVHALIEFETGDATKAISQIESIVAKDPMDGQSIILLAKFQQSQDQRETAEMLLEQAVLLPDHESDALVAHAKLLVSHGEYDAAAKKLRRAIQIKPSPSLQDYLAAVEQLVVE